MNKTNIAVTGYYGTGSSAVTDLLREYSCTSVVPYDDRNFEHTVFYVTGGLFNLCTLLTHGNSPFTSDMVMNNFLDAMERLNKYDFVWFGSYKKMFGDHFEELYLNFVNSLGSSSKGENSNHIIRSRYSPLKHLLQIAAHIILKRNFIQYGRKYVYDGKKVFFSMPSSDEVYKAAREFTRGYFDLFDQKDKRIMIFDHLIWPNQVDEYMDCFDDNFKTIVVDRDPRDVYLLNKYIWFKPPLGHGNPHFPTEVDKFVEEWKKTVVKTYTNSKTKKIHFEDLIYRQEDTVHDIEAFLGILPSEHIAIGKYLDVTRSIENTQVFHVNNDWSNEIKKIESELEEYLYPFPQKRVPEVGRMFDDPRTVARQKKRAKV